jgi:DNA-directed RNA polymerase subunit H (RpoH/RPB5)
MSINVEFSTKELNKIVIENVLNMLSRRKLLKSPNDAIKKLGDDFLNKTIFEVVLDDKTVIGNMVSINLVNAKLSSIVQKTPLDDYLSNNVDVHKIIICKDVAKKVVKQIVSEYKNAEFFFESEMLEDLPSKVFMPEHQLLQEEERKELFDKYSEAELSRIFVTDMMARYYNAKIGDVFRIIRPSFTAGKNVFYRRVVNGSWDILFHS